MKYRIVETHISCIKVGDTVMHEGMMKTVNGTSIKRGGFMGTSLWGDSYHLGNKPVQLVAFE